MLAFRLLFQMLRFALLELVLGGPLGSRPMIPPSRYNTVSNAPPKPTMTRFVFAPFANYFAETVHTWLSSLPETVFIWYSPVVLWLYHMALMLLEVACHLHYALAGTSLTCGVAAELS